MCLASCRIQISERVQAIYETPIYSTSGDNGLKAETEVQQNVRNFVFVSLFYFFYYSFFIFLFFFIFVALYFSYTPPFIFIKF